MSGVMQIQVGYRARRGKKVGPRSYLASLGICLKKRIGIFITMVTEIWKFFAQTRAVRSRSGVVVETKSLGKHGTRIKPCLMQQ